MRDNSLSLFVRKYLLNEGVPCGRHCSDPVRFVAIKENGESLVGVYVCPGNYVSRAVYFSKNPDVKWFHAFLAGQAGEERVRARDLRPATRHGWELGGDAEVEIQSLAPLGVKQYYWTFYSNSESDKKSGTFLCAKENGGCGRIFADLIKEDNKLCPACRSGRTL